MGFNTGLGRLVLKSMPLLIVPLLKELFGAPADLASEGRSLPRSNFCDSGEQLLQIWNQKSGIQTPKAVGEHEALPL